MSDTANQARLASIGEFDARLKRADEDRWLATRYAPASDRERLAAIYLLNIELQRTLQATEAMLGKIRLQWWRETIAQIGGAGAVRRHDLAEELARVMAPRMDLLAPINTLVNAYDDVLDDHLHAGGHQPAADHEMRHLAVEGQLVKLAGLALDCAAPPEHLAVLGSLGEARLALSAELPESAARWTAARETARILPARLWPAILHLAAGSDRASPLTRRWRIFTSALLHRL